ncbi:MAG: hypothetical protein QXS54_10695 [Candidatus Methanomethylicaceae archaeon]
MDREFNFELFTNPDNYEEDLLRERKSQIKYWTLQGKDESLASNLEITGGSNGWNSRTGYPTDYYQ